MNHQETIQITYEAIQNPILRLLIIFLSIGMSSLAGVVVYLYRERQALQREVIDSNRESIRVYDGVENAVNNLRQEIAQVKDLLSRKS